MASCVGSLPSARALWARLCPRVMNQTIFATLDPDPGADESLLRRSTKGGMTGVAIRRVCLWRHYFFGVEILCAA
jgi:hypothetical protein